MLKAKRPQRCFANFQNFGNILFSGKSRSIQNLFYLSFSLLLPPSFAKGKLASVYMKMNSQLRKKSH